MNTTTAHAILGVRLIALFMGALGLWLLVANVIEGVGDFNPSYWLYFVVSQIVRPVVAIAIGLSLWLISGPIGRLFGKDLSK
ncbi:MAG: hypothetical protein AAFX93_09390 [Verrucomicrobiota bacterium]